MVPQAPLDVPALIAWGTKDPVCTLAIAEQLVREIAHSTLVLLDGLSHYPQVEDPEAVGKALNAFWASYVA